MNSNTDPRQSSTPSNDADPKPPEPTVPAGFRDELGRVEQCGIEYIPEQARRSRPRNLITILGGGSLTFSVIIIGWFPISFGLSFWQAASAIVVGSAVGAVLLAPMGLLGPRTGTNNPVSSGAYFGVAGRLIGSFLEATASLAFAALSIWTGGDALAGALTRFFDLPDAGLARLIAYAVLSVIVTTVSVLGHASMVAAQRFMIPTAGVCLLVGIAVYGQDFDPGYAGTGTYTLGSLTATWIASALLAVSTVASYGAYAGDWTRHISPRLHSDRSIWRAMLIGGLFGMGGPFMWGTFTASAAYSANVPGATESYVLGLVNGAPLWFVPALVYLGLASGTAQAVINTYGTGLDTCAIIPRLTRVQATLLACAMATALVYLGYFSSGLGAAVGVFLQLLVCFSIPWIIMVIIGHVRRCGYYDPDALQVFNRGERGGIYWFWHGVNLRGVSVWAVATTAGLLFANTELYRGPGVALTGGADIGFAVAAVVAAILYPLVLRFVPESPAVYGPAGPPSRTVAAHIDTPPTTPTAPHERPAL